MTLLQRTSSLALFFLLAVILYFSFMPDTIGGQVWIKTREGSKTPESSIIVIRDESSTEVDSFGRFRIPVSFFSRLSFGGVKIEMREIEGQTDYSLNLPFSAIVSGSIVVRLDPESKESEVLTGPISDFLAKYLLTLVLGVAMPYYLWKWRIWSFAEEVLTQAATPEEYDDDRETPHEPEALLREASKYYNSHARRLYGTSRVFLILGAFVSVAGIVFLIGVLSTVSAGFSLAFAAGDAVRPASVLWLQFGIAVLPRVTIFLAIEYLAVFFFREYRIGADEFRYYQEIRRQLEASLVIYLFGKDRTDVDFTTFVDACSLFRNPSILKEGETTEFVEAKKGEQIDSLAQGKLLQDLSKLVESLKK